eukprot:CAMPEP_0119275550 /NCGR_PEP_ID=MMETSP1329-20130426/13953_1 /TAXON_ID=114041 /ORGANISM="Genus nov. species nov., Strain RCC1024" /LENGTH=50 /DNA_ID=CAMNT_0007275935 /DNA_START=123 /DNA_END=272 /DNA_ORIENTATION=+
MIDLTADDEDEAKQSIDLTADTEPPPKKARQGKAKARRASAPDGDEALAR